MGMTIIDKILARASGVATIALNGGEGKYNRTQEGTTR